jgi:hypothetical protein
VQKRQLTIITTVLFSIGVISGLVILFDYLTSPHLISREQALAIATKHGGWSHDSLVDKIIDMKLLHMKNDGFSFVVDENTLQDKTLYQNLPIRENQYLWDVKISTCDQNHLECHEWVYWVNATDGVIIPQ